MPQKLVPSSLGRGQGWICDTVLTGSLLGHTGNTEYHVCSKRPAPVLLTEVEAERGEGGQPQKWGRLPL
jgi:hypothetical protein